MQKNTAILVLSHVMNREVMAFFKQIKKECSEYYDVVFLCDNSSGVFDEFKNNNDYYLFTTEGLQSLNYPGRSAIAYQDKARGENPYHKDFNFVPGSIDLPVLAFFGSRPGYAHYWVIEYDVRYSGSWHRFLSSFAKSDAALLGTTLTRYEAIPDWYHWSGLDLRGKPIEKDQYIRGFFPIYRISNPALAQLDRDYRCGVKGHFECLGPTLLLHAGFKLEDLGGNGEFVRPENRNRFYSNTPTTETLAPGSFVFRPVMTRAGKERDTLWHPVKYTPAWRIALRRVKALLRRTGRAETGRADRSDRKPLRLAAAAPHQEHLDALAHVEQGSTAGRDEHHHKQHRRR